MITIVRGLPGSGKTTFAKSLGGVWIEADQLFTDEVTGEYRFDPRRLPIVHKLCQEKAEWNVSRGRDVVVSNTFSQLWEMRPYLDIAKKYGVPVRVVVCRGSFGSVHGVPDGTVSKMRERWENFKGEEEL